MCYREKVSAFLWSVIVLLIPDLTMHETQPSIQSFSTFYLTDLRISGEGSLYSLLPQDPRMDLPSHYRDMKILRNTENENERTNGNDWQSQPAKNQALHLACCFSLN